MAAMKSCRVTGLCGGGGGELFLRCHVPAGGGRTIQIDSHAVVVDDGGSSSSIAATWHDVASLRCDGSPACVKELVDRRSVVFEVRRRRRPRQRRRIGIGVFLGSSSELVGRADVAWRDVAVGDDGDAVVERRVELAAAAAVAAVMWVRMSVRVSETTAAAVSANGRSARAAARRIRERGNGGCEWSAAGGVDDDVFAMAACVADDAFE
uniref:Uncharacterized protein n=1 Tax=Leersia perrieri TaxID=77586 RepID=A0A0D9X1P3_9ORYZ